MTRDDSATAAPLWHQPPLPGAATCLTVQLNATYYRSQASCRWVVILRDPDANAEIGRLIGVTRADDSEAMAALLDDLVAILAQVDYQFHGTVDDLKEALADEPPPRGASPKPRTRTAKLT